MVRTYFDVVGPWFNLNNVIVSPFYIQPDGSLTNELYRPKHTGHPVSGIIEPVVKES